MSEENKVNSDDWNASSKSEPAVHDLQKNYYLGVNNNEVPFTLKKDGSNNPQKWLTNELDCNSKKLIRIDDTSRWRSRVFDDARDRYKKGIPISIEKLTKLKKQSKWMAQRVYRELPRGLISNNSELNQSLLHGILSKTEQTSWLKNKQGLYRSDPSALFEINTPLAVLVYYAKKVHRNNILYRLKVCSDGRHRTFSKPLGTKAGRERLKVDSYAYLFKEQRKIIEPPQGSVIAVLNYCQQEVAILCALSGIDSLLSAYENGDLYDYIYQTGNWTNLSREEFKILVIAYLYGIQDEIISKKWDVDWHTTPQWRKELDHFFSPANKWMDAYIRQAFSHGWVNSMDCRMRVTNLTKPLSLRNWPIQAYGGDILRRACIDLADEKISVIGCLNDAIMIEIPIKNYKKTRTRAQIVMGNASAKVLSGFRLKTSIDAMYWPATGPSV